MPESESSPHFTASNLRIGTLCSSFHNLSKALPSHELDWHEEPCIREEGRASRKSEIHNFTTTANRPASHEGARAETKVTRILRHLLYSHLGKIEGEGEEADFPPTFQDVGGFCRPGR